MYHYFEQKNRPFASCSFACKRLLQNFLEWLGGHFWDRQLFLIRKNRIGSLLGRLPLWSAESPYQNQFLHRTEPGLGEAALRQPFIPQVFFFPLQGAFQTRFPGKWLYCAIHVTILSDVMAGNRRPNSFLAPTIFRLVDPPEACLILKHQPHITSCGKL